MQLKECGLFYNNVPDCHRFNTVWFWRTFTSACCSYLVVWSLRQTQLYSMQPVLSLFSPYITMIARMSPCTQFTYLCFGLPFLFSRVIAPPMFIVASSLQYVHDVQPTSVSFSRDFATFSLSMALALLAWYLGVGPHTPEHISMAVCSVTSQGM